MHHRDRQSRISAYLSSPEKPSPRSSSIITRSSSPSSVGSYSDLALTADYKEQRNAHKVVLGVCAMDIKARSKAMREILTRLVERSRGSIEVKVFGDKVILDEDVENWPRCDILISFFSTDFPLDKAISYVQLRTPFCINDLPTQALLWDRRLVGALLDHLKVPTPKRVEISRDGGPKVEPELINMMKKRLGITLGGFAVTPEVTLREDGNAIIIDGKVMEKPFVEKPVSGEDHNVYIYFRGGGGRRLFRKVGNKSSELDPTLNHPRTDGSYIYEEFIDVDNSEDIKVYTVGTEYTHAETRKSPVVDGVVRRNTEGKEIRFVTRLTAEETSWANKIAESFGQRVCGFDLLRSENGTRSLVIDVNGWSFVKGNDTYYDRASDILSALCMRVSSTIERPLPTQATPQETPTWVLKANVTVFRHADRTPKQKLKFNFPIGEAWTQPFVTLLNGEKEEIILREKEQLKRIATAIEEARQLGADGEELNKLTQLSNALYSKIDLPGTKAQLKPVYSRRQAGQVRKLTKLTLVFKWGGEFTHSARYQSRDLGENLKKDISIMNKEVLHNVKILTSSERRVIASAEVFAAALLDPQHPSYSQPSGNSTISDGKNGFINKNLPQQPQHQPSQPLKLIVRKDLLDDSNAAKDLMDDVKKRLKILLRPGESEKRPELTWPKSMKKEPVEVVKVSELYDTIKYCALHHRTFLFAIFNEQERQTDPMQQSIQQSQDRKIHELYGRAKALFDLVAPQEYGIEPDEKEEIGILTSLPLLKNVVTDLEAARKTGESSLTLYFTKESHIHTLVNLVLFSGLPIPNRRIPELDYASHITFELYERNHGRGKSDKEYSIKISLSEGAHSSNVLDSTLDARHSLNVQPRR
ncbi:hypothetical protein EST38_g701 [Candolleomyces aberdarensis]|uniref:Inositol hexakisphosphate and diphosphoinositol-pentakisphosphate kinase n=1 Tax=Candolleomyces aberdarensis TaxID=2316362 RepID=A0A4Q2E1D7_9AGAR|nr:hypothetical protein EST38_g701 [Candolleomyces aberdarensis]